MPPYTLFVHVGVIMSSKRLEQKNRLHVFQITTALYSTVFIILISYDYAILLQKQMPVFSYLLGIVFAFIAWSIAKFIDDEEGGVKKHAPIFAFLLTISPMGAFKTMLARFESQAIFKETVEKSNSRFRRLNEAAVNEQEKSNIGDRQRKMLVRQRQLNSALTNLMKCGQGPAAFLAIRGLTQLLPGFVEPTQTNRATSLRKD